MKLLAASALTLLLLFSPATFAQSSAEQRCQDMAEIVAVIAQGRDQGMTQQALASALKEALPERLHAAVDSLVDIAYTPEGRQSTPEQLHTQVYNVCIAQK